MKQGADHNDQMMQRVRVGMIGLAAVILLIGLASAVFSIVNRERPVPVAGVPSESDANGVAMANVAAPQANEPLAELGVAPTVDGNSAQAARK